MPIPLARLSTTVLLLGAIVLSAARVAHAAPQSIAIPAYFYPVYPDPTWQQMEDATPTVAMAIMNPASGPGTAADANYVSQVPHTRAAGVAVLGYVDTAYASRTITAVEADIDSYYAWYGVDGIFFDQASNDCGDAPYYTSLDAYVKAKGGLARTVINPGTVTPQCFITTADTIVNFEGSYALYQAWAPLGWESGYSPDHFWHLVYATAETDMPSAVLLSRARGAGWVYVTPDTLVPDPWDSLPTQPYWSTELAYATPFADACSTPSVKSRLTLSHLAAPADDRLAFSGRANLPSNPPLDPVTNGAGVLAGPVANAVVDAILPGGAYPGSPGRGWETNTAHTRWRYRDTTATPIGGITGVQIRRRPSLGLGGVAFSVSGKHGSYTLAPGTSPVAALLVLDGQDPAAACARTTFAIPACKWNASGSAVRCR